MSTAIRTFAGAALVLAACVPLQACGQYGPRGDRGLPPASDGPFPNINDNAKPADPNRRLKSQSEQARLKSDILAKKPQPR